ncbi:MAG: 3-deoxy-manno-octulosonate cytidylyltransferase [Pseudomonadota bacterium]
MNPIVMIPARLASARLPNKPLADIAGTPMIVRVWRQAMEASLGPVLVAAGEQEIADAITEAGGQAVLTDPDLPSGSDRIHQALERADPDQQHDVVVNLQGDLPDLPPAMMKAALATLEDPSVDIGTLAAPIRRAAEREDTSVTKAVIELPEGATSGRALYFTRAVAPSGEGDLYHHIGIYVFRRSALSRFVGSAPGVLERRERLEQLRALALGMRIEVAAVDAVPLSVDTVDDLEHARAVLAETPAPSTSGRKRV